ncbi:uncharacterized protein LOC143363724 [Halictus rubicundus]|uniref:uncharacterized protein LOC143363724 n=1 Tax=Halictus rubicundus TaxID=77578 RepID=UPI00403571BD
MLQTLFEGLQRNISGQFQEQRKIAEQRWEQEWARFEEREAANRTAQAAREAALEGRFGILEAQCQVLSQNLHSLVQPRFINSTENRETQNINMSVPNGSAVPGFPLSQQVPVNDAVGVFRGVSELGYTVKPPRFDGKASWEEYRIQFDTIARANGWDEPRKALALVVSLEGPARGVLTSLSVDKQNDFRTIVSALEFRYGTTNFQNLSYVKFQNYRQRKGESISELAAEIERLAQAAFGECPYESRDKLAASQFVAALANEEMKRILRLGGFTSLRAAVIRALEIEAVESVTETSYSSQNNRYKPYYFPKQHIPGRRWGERGYDRRPEEVDRPNRNYGVLELSPDWASPEGLPEETNTEDGKREEVIVGGETVTSPSSTPVVLKTYLKKDCTAIEGFIDGKMATIIIDTGSSVNLLGTDKFNPRKEEFFLIDMAEECILGNGFLQKHACRLDYWARKLQIAGKEEVGFICQEIRNKEDASLLAKMEEETPVAEEVQEVAVPPVPKHLEDLFQRCCSALSPPRKTAFAKVTHEFQDIFAENPEHVGNCDVVQHRIDTGDCAPIKQAPLRLPFHRRDEVKELLAKMERQGVIEESKSPWSSPIVLVKKKDGSTRFCVDYRRLNDVTKKDSYPLPRIEETLGALAESSWFSTIDLQSGYWQIMVDERDREKTAFCVGEGLWQFRVMPFGLCNAPATFERLMDTKESREEMCEKEEHVFRTICGNANSEEWRKAQETDGEINFILRRIIERNKPNWQEVSAFSPVTKFYWKIWDSLEARKGLLFRRWESTDGKEAVPLLIVPRCKTEEVLRECHNAPWGGHFGVRKTLAKIRQRFFWPDHRRDVEEWCRRCDSCVAKKGPRERGKGSLKIYNVGAPFERIALDIVGPLPKSMTGNRYALVVVDYFSKWPEVIPLPNQKATTIAKTLLTDVISRHGVRLELHSDQGRNFESSVFKELMRLLGIRKTRTTPLHPQSDGLVERMIRTLLQYLTQFVSEHQKDWDEWIPTFLLAYRTSQHEVTRNTPAMVLMGRELRLPLDLLRGSNYASERKEEGAYIGEMRAKILGIHDFVRQRMKISGDKMKSWYDVHANRVSFNPGDKVWLFNPRRTRGRCPKLQSDWEGPYIVKNRLNELIFRIEGTPFPDWSTKSGAPITMLSRIDFAMIGGASWRGLGGRPGGGQHPGKRQEKSTQATRVKGKGEKSTE